MSNNSKTVLVTGASSGFGHAIAQRFLSEGHKVIAVARRRERLDLLKEMHGAALHISQADVRNKESVKLILDELPEAFSDIDCLVNNAGLSLGFGPAHLNSLEDWETVIDTNIKGVLYFTHAVSQIMCEKNAGHIINIGSIAAYYPYIGGNVYAASKSFVNNFSLNLKSDFSKKDIRVTCIAPGLSKTEFALVRFKGDEEKADALYQNAGYLLPEDVAESVYWCFSLPAHVNVNVLELIPTSQSFSLGFSSAISK
jgi:3-hydroxy acid dehydrogenase / malonic semialdehyde reductase